MCLQIHIYLAKEISQEDLKALVKRQFGLSITCNLSIVPVSYTHWLTGAKWPHFTLLGQTLSAALVGYSAARALVPEVWRPPCAEHACNVERLCPTCGGPLATHACCGDMHV